MAYALSVSEQQGLSQAVVENYAPSTWTYMSPGTAFQRVDVPSYSQEYKTVVAKIGSEITVRSIERVQNPYLWGAYLLKKEQNKDLREMQLFHATAKGNIQSITTNNLDWRRTVRSKFGKGVSFSPSASYADKYCNKNTGNNRALILCRVVVGNTCSGYDYSQLPALPGYDTTTGNSGNVYVKYSDNEYYPEYVAYYVNNNPYTGRRTRGYGLYTDLDDLLDLL